MSRFDETVFAARLTEDAAALDIALAEDQACRLVAYLGLLNKWNGVYNLTAIRDPEQMRVQHLLDSLAILPHLDVRGVRSVIDVGTGGGLPGVVLAIMRPQWRIMLNDIVHKKTAFLTQAKGALRLDNVSIHTGRVEALRDPAGYDAVVSRAFADLSEFVALGRHLVSPTGAIFAMKGQQPDDEIGRLPDDTRVDGVVALRVPRLDAARHLVMVEVAPRPKASQE
ncbi:16S rRNA (guanine(527)-N(7))-methyltransferase RsmG [Robbsia sp. Bb-Pol-6]|uniref:Ribosomal RNA small subunit methyltransferase G n=1 Tax=Robbsia betulipollinis TaxID=2981849 RepID=A0ABT3ZRJ4_9BURK|nr:16S rRNA (guanine(527)-N(7))-methyltransferase RsmG [Robbsia betulipollinis]MCY0389168.1 16S rRNA (guanine(527)-N(7))-methyltransferase RsmG [Robbsia betulipollinis]